LENNCPSDMIKNLIRRYERAHFTVERKLYALLKDLMPEELTVDQFNMIRFMQFNGRSTPSELAEVFGVGKSSITAIISRLSDKGLIRRLSEESDRRIVILTLTEEGRRLCESIDARVETMLAGIMNHFGEQEAEQFISTFEKLGDVISGTAGLGNYDSEE
jgi:DNA-binding MarR family transcriptional regulator